jgi:hypothetical protein
MQDINYYKQYVGQSVYGFKFDEDVYQGIGFVESMKEYIGVKGVITRVREGKYCICFDVDFLSHSVFSYKNHIKSWAYPAEEAVKHLHKPDL